MPELSRNFLKGRMNKDLDERVVPAGEYRDALNIEISTSDTDDVGAVENLSGNYRSDRIKFVKPDYDTAETVSGGDRFRFRNIADLSSTAETVGVVADPTTDKIYNFVANASDIDTSGSWPHTGIKSDAIIECETLDRGSGLRGFRQVVLCDVYQVQHACLNSSDSSTNKIIINSDSISGFKENLIGIEFGMEVDLIDADGVSRLSLVNPGADLPTVKTFDFGTSVDPSINIEISHNIENVALAISTFGTLVWKFTKPRFLNFNSSTQLPTTNGGSDNTATPIDNAIYGIDVFDGFLFFTDDKNEPKKINIERFKKGGILGTKETHSIFYTTRLLRPLDSSQTIFAAGNNNGNFSSPFTTIAQHHSNRPVLVEEEHITVIKRQPTRPPTVEAFATPQAGGTSTLYTNVDVTSINLSSYVEGDAVTIQMPATTLFNPGDLISLIGVSGNTDAAIQLIVNAVPPNTLTATSFDCTVFRTDLDGSDLTAGTTPGEQVIADASTTWHATLGNRPGTVNTQAIYVDKFPRFAYRWKYVDGEYSTISPFTKPIFIPGTYNFNTSTDGDNDAEAYNTGMENTIQTIRLKDFLPAEAPKDVVEVELLQALSNSNSIYSIKNFKVTDFYLENSQAFTPVRIRSEHAGTGSFGHQGSGQIGTHQNPGALNNIGVFDITEDLFGSVIEENQLLRNFDNVPRVARAQAVSANRIIYGNYLQSYNIETTNRRSIDVQIDLALKYLPTETVPTAFPLGTTESLKSNRTYEVGVVFKDKFGRETPVLTSKDSSIAVPNVYAPATIKLEASMRNVLPTWVDSYKFYIKETSNEYYNLALYKAYNASEHQTNGEAWLLFNSADSSKVQEGDTLILKKDHSGVSYGDSVNGFAPAEYRVLAKSSTAPTLAKQINGADADTNGSISAADRDGKFFVKVTNDTTLQARLLTDFSGDNDKIGSSTTPAIFETKPDPDLNLNIWYEASRSYPAKLTAENIMSAIAIGDFVQIYDYVAGAAGSVALTATDQFGNNNDPADAAGIQTPLTLTKVEGPDLLGYYKATLSGAIAFHTNSYLGTIHFIKPDGSAIALSVAFPNGTGNYNSVTGADSDGGDLLNTQVLFHCNTTNNQEGLNPSSGFVRLDWYNCFNFGNGVESDRIRDDFNEVQLNNGVRASSTFDDYREDRRSHGLIFSGLYNSNSSVNELNQFIQALPITKDINPENGSIQKIFSRNTDILVFAEDKVLKILANKDALFNAGGNANLTSSSSVLGQAIPFAGDYGISQDPLSFASDEYRCYFADRQRGTVIRLSRDGITPISAIGMSDYFTDTLSLTSALVGSYDDRKQEYNLTIHSGAELLSSQSRFKDVTTVSYSENSKGWSSFKSFIPERGISLNNNYYTFRNGRMYIHHYDQRSNVIADNNPDGTALKCNLFYGEQFTSSITPVFNDVPSAVKSFTTLNYGGTQARVLPDITGTLAVITGVDVNLRTLQFTTAFDVPFGATISGTNIPAGTTVVTTDNVATDGNEYNLIVGMSADATSNIAAGTVITFYDEEWYNNMPAQVSGGRPGWYVESISTDLQDGQIADFRRKESKWFNFIRGTKTTWTNAVEVNNTIHADAIGNIDSQEFSFQGLGMMNTSNGDSASLTSGSIDSTFSVQVSDTSDVDTPGGVNLYSTDVALITGLSGTVSTTGFITITPDLGVFLQASDFTISGGTANSEGNFVNGQNGVTLPSQISKVTFTNTATADQLAQSFTGNTIKATFTFSGFTISADQVLTIDIDLTEGSVSQTVGIPVIHRQGFKNSQYINQNHTITYDTSAQPNMTPSTNITGTPRFSFNSSTKVLSHAAGHEQATANSAGSVTGTTHVLTSDIASSLLAGSNITDSHSAYFNGGGFIGFVDSVTDLGSTTQVQFGASVTVPQNSVIDFIDGILNNAGNPQIGTYNGSIQIVPGEATEFKKFVITCDSGFKITNFTVSLDSQGSDVTNSMLSFTTDDTVDGSGNVTARTATVFINIPVDSPLLQSNGLGVHLFYSLTINPI
jgi:hypothetical protein